MYTDNALKKISQLLKIFSNFNSQYKVKIHSWEDFKHIPISGRQELKTFLNNKLIHNAFNVSSTSGSTSNKMLIAHSKETYELHKRRLVKLYRQFGIKKGDLCLNFCSYEMNSGGRLMETAFKACSAGVIPLGPISSKDKILEAVHLINKLKPTVINAYTNQLYDLFSVLGRKHSIRQCMVTGEVLWPEYKHRIEKMGDVQIHDHYGAMEFSGLAVAINPNNEYMKLFAEGLLLEVLGDSGSTDRTGIGALLVTDLNNHCMPFIRYHLGDEVDLIHHKGSLWIKVLGRTNDSLSVNGVVAIKKELIRTAHDFIGHPNFFFILDKHRTSYKDKLIVNIAGNCLKDLQLLPKAIMKATGLDDCIIVRKHKGIIPKTINGKIKYFVKTNTEKKSL